MTIEALRKVIMVTTWSLTKDGLTISYVREDHNPKSLHLILAPAEATRELTVIGTIDSAEYYGEDKVIINYNDGSCVWDGFIGIYKLCQWEALSIAIRHEAEKELANDVNILELDSALDALK